MHHLKDKSIIVVAHTLWTGPGHDLEEYLISQKIKNLIFIGHPIYYREGRPGPQFRYYKNGNLVKDKEYSYRPLPGVLQFVKDVFLTVLWVTFTMKKWDLLVALDCLNAFSGLILRTMGIVRKVVYYTIDYTPQRFNIPLLNDIYHFFDKICVAKADQTWNVSPRMVEGRNKHRGLRPKKYPHQKTVPIGIWFDRISRKPYLEIEPHTLVYMGGLVEKSGIQIVLDSIPEILQKIYDFKFLVIGSGEYESVLQKKSNRLGLNDVVTFTGYIESHKEVEHLMSKCGVAIAPYNEILDDWTYYADPAKIKSYLASGLPIITTSLPYNAKYLKINKCGILINYNKSDLTNAVVALMNNPKMHQQYRENAIQYGSRYNWDSIFYDSLEDVFKKNPQQIIYQHY
jgi:glycosyltransferase involved in cell wall biosynthesis